MTFPANVFAATHIDHDALNRADLDILDDLNPSQRDAVVHPGGPLLVVAGAGSGKTRVLTRRIAYLISEHRVSPYEILAITFTNKAASEMVERVAHLVGPVASRMWVSTFHSACARILRIDGTPVGVKSGFSIYDTADATRLTDYARRDLGADPKRFSAKSLHRMISGFKNELITPAQALEKADMDTERTVAKIYAEYEHRLRAANAVDFDDLLVKTVELLRDHDGPRDKYQTRFQHVLVDEFQDTNLAQWSLVNLLSQKHRNITVVGDADQSIYRFRGADHLNMERFEEEYENASVVVLNTNYRSTENILAAANAVISNNESRHKKELISNKGSGESITVFYANNDRNEADFVSSTIASLMNSQSLNDIAVFYRTNAQSRLIEEKLIRAGISYRIIGGTKFFDRKEVKDAVAYLRIIANPADEASWRRIVNEPKRGVGDTSITKVAAFSRMYDITFRQACERPGEVGLSKRASNAVLGLCSLFDRATMEDRLDVGDILQFLLTESGYIKMLEEENTHESQGRLENLIELVSQAREFDRAIDDKWKNARDSDKPGAAPLQYEDDEKLIDTSNPFERVTAFLEAVSLLADADQADESDEKVTLMTLHTAKGLEFPTVFITGLEEGLFPHERSMGDPLELEEERRLCYVGITRAMDRLYLSCALSRMMFATPDYFSPSRFLKEIPTELVTPIEDPDSMGDYSRPRNNYSSSSSNSRYSGVHDDVTFDDINPDDDEISGNVYGGSRRKDFATTSRVRSSIWDSQPKKRRLVVIDFDLSDYAVGAVVNHAKYGTGRIVAMETETNGDTQISIDFPGDQIRNFMASFNPPLTLISKG